MGLSPDYYEHCADEIINLYADLENAIVSDITRRILKTGTITESAKWQINQLQEVGLLYDDIISEIASRTDGTDAHVRALFEDAGVKAVEFDNQIYRKAGLVPVDIRQSVAMQQVLEAGYKKTLGNMQNLTLTTANTAQTAYYKACNSAYMMVTSGAFDYKTAIKTAIQTAAEDGATVLYPSGHVDRLDVAIRRSVLTGVGQTCRTISETNAQENDCDLMEISAHSGARPSHAEWQGQIVSLSGRKGYLTKDDIGYGTGAGFGGWNCRHDWYPYFEGISTRNYTQSDLDTLNAKDIEYNGKMYSEYEISQIQRRMEREIRALKREKTAYETAISETSNKELKEMFQTALNFSKSSIRDKQAKMRDFINQTGQQRDYFREQNYTKISQNGLTYNNNNGILTKEETVEKAKQLAKNPELNKYLSEGMKYIKNNPKKSRSILESMFQQIMKFICENNGYDALPTVASKEEFDILAMSRDVLYRGISSSNDKTSQQLADDFKHGDLFIGTGKYGVGTYTTYNRDIANSYGESAFNYNRNAVGKNNGDKNVSILRIIPSNEVKFADYKELWTEWFDLKEQRAKISDCDEEYYYILKNIGIYAMLKGYDAIALNGFGGFDYVIILNRGKFIVEE